MTMPTNFFTNIANAIRSKKGTTDPIPAINFPAEIASITTGGTTPSIGVVPTEWDAGGYVIKCKTYGIPIVYPNHFNKTIKEVEFDSTLTQLGIGVFRDNLNLTKITFPNTLTTIKDFALSGCKGLTSIHYPNSVSTITGYAFYDAGANIKTVTFEEGRTIIPDNACYDFGITSITIPSTVTTIKGMAFKGCIGLTSIHYPNSVSTINSYAFYNAGANIETVTFEEGRTIIPDNACYDFGITSLNLPSTVTTIRGMAFKGCNNLTSVTLGSVGHPITSINSNGFYNCLNLTSITVHTTNGAPLAGAPWGATNATITYLSA